MLGFVFLKDALSTSSILLINIGASMRMISRVSTCLRIIELHLVLLGVL